VEITPPDEVFTLARSSASPWGDRVCVQRNMSSSLTSWRSMAMDAGRFDWMVRTLACGVNRRQAIGALTGGTV
jgi:hypothetical protein